MTLACLILTSGCGIRQTTGPAFTTSPAVASPSPAGGSPLPLVAPPTAAPDAQLVSGTAREPGLRVASRWSDRSGAVVEETPREPVRWPNPITRRTRDAAWIDLDTDVQPIRAEFRSYHSIDSRTGVPNGAGVAQLCRTPAIDAAACRTSVDSKTVRVDLPTDVGRYVILYAEWYVPADLRVDPAVSTYSTSWAFHLR